MVILGIIGTLLILAGIYTCTESIDNYWRSKQIRPQPKRSPTIPPFITTLTQCVDCGTEGDLLNLDRKCFICHERQHING